MGVGMADRNLRVRIGLDTSGLTAAADAAAAALGRVAAAATAAGSAAQAGAERASAASATQSAAARGAAVTQEGLIRSTAQAAVRADFEVQAAAERTAAAQVAAAEAMAAAYEAAYRASALAAAGASEAEIAAARSVVGAQSTAAAEAAAAVKAAAAEETAAAEASAAAQIAAAKAVADAQAIAAAAGTTAARRAAAESRAISQAAVAANRVASANAAADAAAASAVTRAAAAEARAAAGGMEAAATGAVTGMSLKSMGIAAGFILVGKSILTQTRDYELAMNTLQGVTGSTAATMAQAGAKAQELGADITIPGASAADAAHAMLELVKAGFSVSQSEQAAKASLQLAASAHIEAGKAAEFQGQILNMFGLNATDASHAADVLANTANAASGNITDFMYAMNAAGPASHSLHISIDDTATAMGMLAKAGILGSNAGTEYARMLQSMEKPSKKAQQALDDLGVSAWTADGQFVGLPVIIDQLSKAHERMTPQAYASAAAIAFGAHAVKAAETFAMEGIPVWDDLASKVGKVGGNADTATAMMQGLPGAMENIKNNASNLALTIGGAVSPALSGLLNGVSALIGGFVNLPGPIQTFALTLGAVVLLRGPLNAMATGVMGGFRGIGTAVREMQAAISASTALAGVEMSGLRVAAMLTGTALKAAFLSNPIGWAILGITTALAFFTGGTDDAGAATDAWNGKLADLKGTLDATTASVTALTAQKIGEQIGSETIARWQALGINIGLAREKMLGVPAAASASDTALQGLVSQSLQADEHFLHFAGTLQQAGVSSSEFAASMMNNDFSAMNAKLAAIGVTATDAGNGVTALKDANGTLLGAISSNLGPTGELIAAYHTMNGEAGLVSGAQKDLTTQLAFGNAALGDAATSTDGMSTANDNAAASSAAVTAALKAQKDATQNAKDQTDFLTLSLQQMAGRDMDAEAAARANAAAARGVGQAARDQVSANLAVVDAQKKLVDVQSHLHDSSSKTRTTTEDLTKAQLALDDATSKQQAGVDNSQQAWDQYASTAAAMVDVVHRQALAQGTATDATAAAVNEMQIQRDEFIKNAINAGMEAGAAQNLADKLGLIPANVKTAYDAQNLDAAAQKFANMKKVIDLINNTPIADKNFQIHATVVQTGSLAGGIHISSPAGGSGTITRADGGFVEAGMTHAANGLLRQPMIVTGGRGITWAEPETGWEAYISGKPGQEAANRKILGIAAGRLGMSAVGSDGAAAPTISTVSTATHNVYNGGANVSTMAPVDNRVYNIHVTNTAQKPLGPDDIRYLLKQGERS